MGGILTNCLVGGLTERKTRPLCPRCLGRARVSCDVVIVDDLCERSGVFQCKIRPSRQHQSPRASSRAGRTCSRARIFYFEPHPTSHVDPFFCSSHPWVNPPPPPPPPPRQRVVRCNLPRAVQSRPADVPLTTRRHRSTHSIKCPRFPKHRWTTPTSSRRNAHSPQYHALSTLREKRHGNIHHHSSFIMHWSERDGRRL